MTVRIEKQDKVWTVIHSRLEAKNAMDPASAAALEAMRYEWENGVPMVAAEGRAGAARVTSGKGRGGNFGDI